MKRFHARVKVVQMLKDAGLYVEEKDNPMNVPICSYVQFQFSDFSEKHDSFTRKSGDIIEPVMKPQWWVNCKPLAEEAIRVRSFACCTCSKLSDIFSVADKSRRTHHQPEAV